MKHSFPSTPAFTTSSFGAALRITSVAWPPCKHQQQINASEMEPTSSHINGAHHLKGLFPEDLRTRTPNTAAKTRGKHRLHCTKSRGLLTAKGLHYIVLYISDPDQTRASSQTWGGTGEVDIIWSASSVQQEASVLLTWKMNQTPFSSRVWVCSLYDSPEYINTATSYHKRLNLQHQKQISISECEEGKHVVVCGSRVQTDRQMTPSSFITSFFHRLVKMSPSEDICSPLYWLHSMLNASIGGQISFSDEPLVSKGWSWKASSGE